MKLKQHLLNEDQTDMAIRKIMQLMSQTRISMSKEILQGDPTAEKLSRIADQIEDVGTVLGMMNSQINVMKKMNPQVVDGLEYLQKKIEKICEIFTK